MKKFIVFILVILLAAVLGMGVFIATFDANRFKPQAARAIEKVVGGPVEIGSLGLGWSGGLVLQMNKLAIYPSRESMEKSAATLERANAYLKLGPLLKRKLEIVSLTLVRPRLNIIKEANGILHVSGINPPRNLQSAQASAPSQDAAFRMESFSIGIIKVEDGEIGFVDKSSTGVVRKLAVKDLDILIRNLSFKAPVDFGATFALFSDSQNTSVKAKLLIDSLRGPYTVQNFELTNNLETVKPASLFEAIPSAAGSGLADPLRGEVRLAIERFVLSDGRLGDLNVRAALEAGVFQTKTLRSPFEEAAVLADVTQNDVNLRKFSSRFAEGRLEAQAFSKNYLSDASQTHVGFKADRLKFEKLLPAPKPGRPQLQGNFSMVFNGDAVGLSWPSISRTLNGAGRVTLTDGLIVNLNLLKTIFDKLSKIPGVSDALNNYLPPAYRERLSKPVTVLEPLDFNVNVVNGQLVFQELRVSSMGFQLAGAGQAALNGEVDFQATLFLDPEISRILLSNVSQMQFVANAQGLVAVPVRLTGTVQNLSVEPDMDFIFKKVLFEKGQKLVGEVLEKALTKTGETSQSAAETGGSAYKNILGRLLQ